MTYTLGWGKQGRDDTYRTLSFLDVPFIQNFIRGDSFDYAQIARCGPKSMIINIEGGSIVHTPTSFHHKKENPIPMYDI